MNRLELRGWLAAQFHFWRGLFSDSQHSYRPSDHLIFERNLLHLASHNWQIKSMRMKATGAQTAKILDAVALVASVLLQSSTLTRVQNYTNFTIELETHSVIPNASPGISL